MNTDDPTPDLPPPPPVPDPAAVAVAQVRALVRHGHVGHALEVALSAAQARGMAALEPYRAAAEPATVDEAQREAAVRRFLLAAQATAEEMDRLALAVAEG